jgi:transcription elongation GreA/GreB family factor
MKNDEELNYISRKGYFKLIEKINNIDNEIENVLNEMGESCKRDNDLRENPEFMDLRVKAMYSLPREKERLVELYTSCTIIEEMDDFINWDGETVVIGSDVELILKGEIRHFRILGTSEGDLKNGIISCNARLAQVLIGHKVGEQIEFNNMNIEIIGVSLELTNEKEKVYTKQLR